MAIFLFIIGIIAFIGGIGSCSLAKSSIHEIEAYILFLIGVVCIAGAGIIESVNKLRNKIAPDKAENENDKEKAKETEQFYK